MTSFDLVLLLIISETVQQAMVDDDRHSLTNGMRLILTRVGASSGLSLLKQRFPRVDEGDLLEAARQAHGLERLDQIKYAVLERNGEITIVPTPGAR